MFKLIKVLHFINVLVFKERDPYKSLGLTVYLFFTESFEETCINNNIITFQQIKYIGENKGTSVKPVGSVLKAKIYTHGPFLFGSGCLH